MEQEKPAPRKAKIVEFGNINESSKGNLVFSSFRVEYAGEFANPAEAVLKLVIERLQTELHEYQNRKANKD